MAELELPPLLGLPTLLRKTPSELSALMSNTHAATDLSFVCMQMFYVLIVLTQNEFALEMQTKALSLQRVYRLAGPLNPKVRLLVIFGPGNMQDNTPIEFVLDNSDVQMDMLFILAGQELPELIPEHDIAFVAIGESDKNSPILTQLALLAIDWPRPILNHPDNIKNGARDACYRLLKDVDGLVVPRTVRWHRHDRLDMDFPMTIRPVDTQGGNGLRQVGGLSELDAYLDDFPSPEYYVAQFVDYRSTDGKFRKLRIVLIDAKPYVCHLAISESWMVHYLSAGMEASAEKRSEEALFMETFDDNFAVRYRHQLETIAKRLKLDYVTLDCAELDDGRLLLFEADSRGLIHAFDPIDVYPYKPPIMQKAFDAFRALLSDRGPREHFHQLQV